MKVEWHREDIYAGLRVQSEGNSSHGVMIGYIEEELRLDQKREGGHQCKLAIVSLDDGLVIRHSMSYTDVALYLTTYNYLPLPLIGRRQTEFRDVAHHQV